MTQPGNQYAQNPQQRGPQFMQPLGGISQPGQHVLGAMNVLRCLQQHTRHNESEYYHREDTSDLLSVPASCYAPSSDYSMSDMLSIQHKQYYQDKDD